VKLLILLKHRFELWTPPDWFAQRLRQEFPDIDVVHLRDYERVDEELPDAEVLIGWSLRGEQFLSAKKLKWIHSTAAAVHALISPELAASDVVVTNARSVHAPVVAEHAVALMFALAKRLPSAMRHQQASEWAQTDIWHEQPHPRELAGSTLGMIGYGAIGREVASHALALGMKVMAVRRKLRAGEDAPHTAGEDASATTAGGNTCATKNVVVFAASQLDQALSQSDFVVLATPLTPATTGMIGAEQFRAMKNDAYLINVGRGALIDEAALLKVLEEGEIGGAALDVFVQEPLPPDSPLWTAPNLLITPHSAGFTERMWERHYELFSENLRRYRRGEELLGRVDPSAGY
jgi:phosphoglycerate dehydrogenase-like enzyme